MALRVVLFISALTIVCSSGIDVVYKSEAVLELHYDAEQIHLIDVYGCYTMADNVETGCNVDETIRVRKGIVRDTGTPTITTWSLKYQNIRIHYITVNDNVEHTMSVETPPMVVPTVTTTTAATTPTVAKRRKSKPNVYKLYFAVIVLIVLALYAAITYYMKRKVRKVPPLPRLCKERVIKNVKRATTLGMYVPGTITRTEIKHTVLF